MSGEVDSFHKHRSALYICSYLPNLMEIGKQLIKL